MGNLLSILFEILPLKKADAQSVYSSLINWLKQRNIQISKLVGMGFDGAASLLAWALMEQQACWHGL